MAWQEPLTASTRAVGNERRVSVRDGANVLCAMVNYKVNLPARHGVLGEVEYKSAEGTTRQKVRAFSLLIRECIRGGLAEGIETYFAETHPQMIKAVNLLTGHGWDLGQAVDDAGRLSTLDEEVAVRTDADGHFRDATPTDEEEIAASFPTRPEGTPPAGGGGTVTPGGR